MTRDEIKNTPELVDHFLDESIIADSKKNYTREWTKYAILQSKRWSKSQQALVMYVDIIHQVVQMGSPVVCVRQKRGKYDQRRSHSTN